MKKLLCVLFALVLINTTAHAQRSINYNWHRQQLERRKKDRAEKILRRRQYILSRKIRTQHLPAKSQQQLNGVPIKDSTINKKAP